MLILMEIFWHFLFPPHSNFKFLSFFLTIYFVFFFCFSLITFLFPPPFLIFLNYSWRPQLNSQTLPHHLTSPLIISPLYSPSRRAIARHAAAIALMLPAEFSTASPTAKSIRTHLCCSVITRCVHAKVTLSLSILICIPGCFKLKFIL